jgi:Uma2 family endonuclease
MPDLRRAEMIEGVVNVPSPRRYVEHDEPAASMVFWAAAYTALHPGLRSGGSASLFLDERNEVQPDAFIFRPEPGGSVLITPEGYLQGAPQLVVEVAASTLAADLGAKMEAYRRNNVREYIVWRVPERAISWFRLVDGAYVLIEPDEQGVIESREFPGLRLNVPAMLAGDRAGVLAELQRQRPG